jgi:hypothetical protein
LVLVEEPSEQIASLDRGGDVKTEDQEAVEALLADRADPTLEVRVRGRRL